VPAPYVPGSTTLWNQNWRSIYDHFGPAILAYARRLGLSEHSAEDVLQEVMTTLIRCECGQAAAYRPRAGPFQSWLWGVIRNRVRSIRRHDQRAGVALPAAFGRDESPGIPETAEPPDNLDLKEEQAWQQALLAAAMRKMQQRVTHKNFAIYSALLEEKATPKQLAATYKVQINAVYAAKHRCEEILVAEARILREQWEQLSRAGRGNP
jgi:RNA polymerase sigma factor (sigma-70 family)